MATDGTRNEIGKSTVEKNVEAMVVDLQENSKGVGGIENNGGRFPSFCFGVFDGCGGSVNATRKNHVSPSVQVSKKLQLSANTMKVVRILPWPSVQPSMVQDPVVIENEVPNDVMVHVVNQEKTIVAPGVCGKEPMVNGGVEMSDSSIIKPIASNMKIVPAPSSLSNYKHSVVRVVDGWIEGISRKGLKSKKNDGVATSPVPLVEWVANLSNSLSTMTPSKDNLGNSKREAMDQVQWHANTVFESVTDANEHL
ncbi:hypothetical protein V6N11_012521 [Hibiscus sabdariffa]|uniref:Uncharacterized protein n=2 Tax=Hibiscus sabdariffa TaxID=183260 RepID=A0ABR2BD13_9ROSI